MRKVGNGYFLCIAGMVFCGLIVEWNNIKVRYLEVFCGASRYMYVVNFV